MILVYYGVDGERFSKSFLCPQRVFGRDFECLLFLQPLLVV